MGSLRCFDSGGAGPGLDGDEEKKVVLEAKAARDAALGEVVDVRDLCKALEDELQGLRDQLVKEVRLRQEQEEGVKAREAAIKEREVKLRKRRDRLGALEQELGRGRPSWTTRP